MKSGLSITGPGVGALQVLARELGMQPEIHAGILGDAPVEGSGLTMVELGLIHEYGAPRANIPERSWYRATADTKGREWMALLERVITLAATAAGKGDAARARDLLRRGYAIVGAKVVADMQARIRSNIPPPLQPATIRRKGSSVALIDSGRFLQSISFEVVVGESGVP